MPLVLVQAAPAVVVDGRLEGPEEAALVVEKRQGYFPPEQGGDGLAGELGGLSSDHTVQIPQGEMAQFDVAGASSRIRSGDDEALRLEVNAAAGLIDDGGRHDGGGMKEPG